LTAQCNEILDLQQNLTQLDQLYYEMPVTYAEIEELVIQACEDLQTQENPKIAATARKYNAPKDRRWNGLSRSRIDAGGADKALDDTAEEALCLYIEFADNTGISI
jgi:hypothetical protein